MELSILTDRAWSIVSSACDVGKRSGTGLLPSHITQLSEKSGIIARQTEPNVRFAIWDEPRQWCLFFATEQMGARPLLSEVSTGVSRIHFRGQSILTH